MFAQWRLEAGNLGELEPRLLAIVLAQLRVDLQSQRHRNRAIYYGPANGSFWQEKAADFAHVAGEVAAKNRQSGAAAVAIADYLVEGLKRPDRAVEILLDAHRRQLLDDAGQEKLARLLQERSRYAESVAVLQPLVRRQADNITYRVLLMRACFHTARSADLTALLKETDAYFHQKDRWCEWFMCQLAEGCLESGLPEQSAGYWREAIAAHQHAAPRRGIGDDTLGGYYGGLARAYAGEKKTPEAADAACGAVVSWGPRQSQRAEALATLQKVLDEAQDLDGYLTALDRRAAAAGEDNAIVRKAAGQVYAARKQYARAVTQLRAAEELQPGDAETYRALLECYDRLNDQHGAIETLLRCARVGPPRRQALRRPRPAAGLAGPGRRGGAGLHLDRRDAPQRSGEPPAPGRNSPAPEPLAGGHRPVAAGRPATGVGADRPAGLDGRVGPRGSLGRGRRGVGQARRPRMAAAVRPRGGTNSAVASSDRRPAAGRALSSSREAGVISAVITICYGYISRSGASRAVGLARGNGGEMGLLVKREQELRLAIFAAVN